MSKRSRKYRRQRRFPTFWVLAIGGLLLVTGVILLSRPGGGTSGGGAVDKSKHSRYARLNGSQGYHNKKDDGSENVRKC